MNGYDPRRLTDRYQGRASNQEARNIRRVYVLRRHVRGGLRRLLFALGVDHANKQLRKFEVIQGGVA